MSLLSHSTGASRDEAWTRQLWQEGRRAAGAHEENPPSELDVPLDGVEQILRVLRALGGGARHSLMTALPFVPSHEALVKSYESDLPMLQRGVRMHSLFPLDALGSSWMHAYARHVSARGAEVRSGYSGDVRYLVFDRSVAVVAEGGVGSDRRFAARMTRSEGIVQALVTGFETLWSQARDLREAWIPLTERQELVLRALIGGETVEAIARRMRVSKSTVERDLVELRRRFEAPTREALVVEAVLLGWSHDDQGRRERRTTGRPHVRCQ